MIQYLAIRSFALDLLHQFLIDRETAEQRFGTQMYFKIGERMLPILSIKNSNLRYSGSIAW
jgi:hypothetical protein